MKIHQLEIEGYRSLKSQSWSPGDLNVLIGPNASGKSNVLRALELLNFAAKGELGRYVLGEGGMDSIVWDGRVREIRLSTETRSDREPLESNYRFEICLMRIGNSSAYRIEHENLFYALWNEETRAFENSYKKLIERDPMGAIAFSTDSKRIEFEVSSIAEEESLLSVFAVPFHSNQDIAAFQKEMAGWKIYQNFRTDREAPIRIPQIARADTRVNADGRNLISVLHTRYTNDRDFENEIDTAMGAAFGDDYEKLIFPPAADQRIQMRIRLRSLKREIAAADLSDGTLRFLFLLAVLADPSPPSLIAIDEPETGLHPSMLPIVAEYARQASIKSQVILTTHSPDFLDAFGSNPPTTTIVESNEGESVLRVVADDELSYWLKKYSLGELYRSKELEAMK